MVKASLEDVAMTSEGNQFLVLLKTEQSDIVPIVIGPLEAMSIAAGRSKESLPRPMSHDLMLSMLELLNAEIERIEVTDLIDGTFYAKLIIKGRGIEFEIDSRPSDALALAVRVNAPLFIAKKVIEQTAMTDLPSSFGGFEA